MVVTSVTKSSLEGVTLLVNWHVIAWSSGVWGWGGEVRVCLLLTRLASQNLSFDTQVLQSFLRMYLVSEHDFIV